MKSHEVCEELLQLLEHLKRCMLTVAERRGLTRMQLFSLYSIHRHGDVAMGQVAGLLGCDASNVTGIVDRLVVHGLITRTESPQDRRTKILHLTPAGKELIEGVTNELPVELGCSRLTDDDLSALSVLIRKLTV